MTDEIIIREPTLLIMCAKGYQMSGSVYFAVRQAWRLDPSRARGRLVLAHAGAAGVGRYGPYEVMGAYRSGEWLPATLEHFPELTGARPGRWGFHGVEAEHWHEYVGRVVPERYRGGQNAVRYCGHPDDAQTA